MSSSSAMQQWEYDGHCTSSQTCTVPALAHVLHIYKRTSQTGAQKDTLEPNKVKGVSGFASNDADTFFVRKQILQRGNVELVHLVDSCSKNIRAERSANSRIDQCVRHRKRSQQGHWWDMEPARGINAAMDAVRRDESNITETERDQNQNGPPRAASTLNHIPNLHP